MDESFQYPNKKLEYWNGCQRNWDYDQPVKQEHVKELIDIALSAPSKNNLNLLEIQVFENSLETQKNISETARGSETESIKSSTEAPLTFFFGYRRNQKQWLKAESLHDYQEMLLRAHGEDEIFYKECMRHADMAASVIVGALSIKAIEFGYKTGINCCFMDGATLHNSESIVFLSVGIGNPLHEDHLLRGLSNTEGERGQGPYRKKHQPIIKHIKDNLLV